MAAPVIEAEPPVPPTVAAPPPLLAPPPPRVTLSEGRGYVIGSDGGVYGFAIGGRPPIEDTVATRIAGLADAATLAVGGEHLCIASSAGEITCVVAHYTGSGSVSYGPAQRIDALQGARIAARRDVICALDPAGAVRCAGYAGAVATPVALPSPAVDLTSNDYETCAALAEGVLCWERDRAPSLVATRLNGARAIAMAPRSTCALGALGTDATCYGDVGGWYFEDFEWEDEERGPVNAMEAPVSPGAPVPLSGPMRSISTAMDHACALSETGGVSCWGTAFRTGRHEGFEPRAVRGWASGVTEIAGGGGPYVGVTCAVQGGVLRCFSAPGSLLDARPGAEDFRVCLPSEDGTCSPFRVGGAPASAVPPAAPGTTVTAEGAPAAPGCVVRDASGTPLNVRAEASGRAAVVGTLANDTRIDVLESHGPWRRIDGPPAGWVWNEAIFCE